MDQKANGVEPVNASWLESVQGSSALSEKDLIAIW